MRWEKGGTGRRGVGVWRWRELRVLELDSREVSRICWRGMKVGRGQQEV